jgi:L-arabinose isomerase
MPERSIRKGRVGLFAVGLKAYWAQFPGLKKRLENYARHVAAQLEPLADVVDLGLVDTAPAAFAAGQKFAASHLDLLICYTATYATSSQVLPIVQSARVPVLVLNLQPAAALDYENTDTGEWLANCSACCVPEISNAFARSGIDFRVVSGTLFDDPRAWGAIADWCRASGAARSLKGARFGFLGHVYPGMLDMVTDFTQMQAQLGLHVEILEMDDLKDCVDAVKPSEVSAKLAQARRMFQIDKSVTKPQLDWACKVAAGLDRLVKEFGLDALNYYYRGTRGNEFERLGAGLILGNSLLTARGIPCAGEGDFKNTIAMKLMDSLGAGGSFTELYAMDFKEDFVLMGHDGPGHLAISDEKPVLRGLGLYHGKRGQGVSVEFKVKTGPVTLLALTEGPGNKLKVLAAQAESIPGPILKIGNTNSRLKFAVGPAEFVDAWCLQGPAHHCALGVGHLAGVLEKLAHLLKLSYVEVGRA